MNASTLLQVMSDAVITTVTLTGLITVLVFTLILLLSVLHQIPPGFICIPYVSQDSKLPVSSSSSSSSVLTRKRKMSECSKKLSFFLAEGSCYFWEEIFIIIIPNDLEVFSWKEHSSGLINQNVSVICLEIIQKGSIITLPLVDLRMFRDPETIPFSGMIRDQASMNVNA